MLLRFLPLIALVGFLNVGLPQVGAQDVHYTLHNMAPLWLNPAKTGGFLGSVRVGGIYRGQWYGYNDIQSPTIYADAPIVRGLREQDWIGVGFSLISDKAGDDDISRTNTGLSASYHFALDKDQRTVLTLGGYYGSVGMNFDVRDAPTVEQTIPTALGGLGLTQSEFTNTSTPNTGDKNNVNYTDISAGLVLRTRLGESSDLFEIGVAMLHLNQDEPQSLLGNSGGSVPPGTGTMAGSRERDVPSTLHSHLNLDMSLTDKWRLMPTAFFQSSNGTSSISLQGWVGRELPNDRLLRLGLGYRTNDAVKALVGFDAGQLQAALAFDLIVGQKTALDLRSINAFELSANYIFNFVKQPEAEPKALCPRI